MARKIFLSLMLALTVAGTAFAVEPDERLDDPALEARAREISQHLRCLVCQNQSIDDSNATLARDLRVLVRQRLTAGDSNDEAIQYVVDRYGDFVLLKPPVKPITYVLWLTPFGVLLIAAWVMVRWYRRRPAAVTASPLSEAEAAELDNLVKDVEEK